MLERSSSEGYRVQLKTFEGPLDLLLQLIERREMDITKVSLALVTDQYLEYIATMKEVEAENIAEFLVIAAKLLLIKSRALLPQPPAASEEEEDTGEDLVEQLKLYRTFKQAAAFLQKREELGLRSYTRIAPPPSLERRLEPSSVGPEVLAAAMYQMLQSRKELAPVNHVVAPIIFSIQDKIAQIESLLQRQEEISFQHLLRACTSKLEVIIVFLAVLEMMKKRRIVVRQERLFGTIFIARAEATADQEVTESV